MGKADERRSEQRLHYRWGVRFTCSTGGKPLSGQMFDVSSNGMALLFHANEKCPRPGQSITANFGVPCFDSRGSFETMFFNRIGRVCRVDRLNSKVNRVSIRFTEPLFFKPGEQKITESEAQQRLQTKAQSVAKAKAEAEEKQKAEIKTGHKTEAEATVETEQEIRAQIEARVKAEERARSEAQARAQAEERAKSQAKLRAKAEKKAKAEVKNRTETEAEAKEKSKFYQEQVAKIKAEAAREIARLKAETADTLAQAEAEFKAKVQSEGKETAKSKKKSRKGGLVEKVDGFITDRSKIH
ncbi:MAG: PilZ domain-containing protein [Planctomycetota bacterium]